MTKFWKGVQLVAAIFAVAIMTVVTAHLMGVAGVVLAAAFVGWPDSNLGHQPVKRGNPSQVVGAEGYEFVQSFEKATTDGDNTVYALAVVPSDAVLASLLLNCDALAGLTSADLGLYRMDRNGAIVSTVAGAAAGSGGAKSDGSDGGALLMSAVDIHLGKANGSEQNGLAAVDIADLGKKLWSFLGITDPKLKDDKYILGLRLNTAGAAAGTITVRGRYIQG